VITPYCAGLDFPHLLRHDADIKRVISALVAEAIEFETIIEPHQRRDVLLEADVGTTSTTSTSATAMSTSAMHAAPVRNVMPAAYGTAVMRHVMSTLHCAAVMRNVVSGLMTRMVSHVVTCLVTRMVRDVMTCVVRDVVTHMPPTMPADTAAPPEPPHPGTIIAHVPAGSIPAVFVPAISATVPDVLRVLDQSRIACRVA
jgi:hypothetical protein